MTTKFKTDKEKLKRAMFGMAKDTFHEVKEEIQKYITEEKRENYPRTTKRKFGRGVTGKTAGSTRDVVDSGDLANSLTEKEETTGFLYKLILEWSVAHAEIVYTGWETRTGKEIPPYPWVMLALKEVIDWEKLFKKYWNEYDK